MRYSQITEWCHAVIRSQTAAGGIYVDATMGNGHDTLFLCGLAGMDGTVWAFDIQEKAVLNTRALLSEHGYGGSVHLIKDGHENMDRYLKPGSADVVCFNFGYLPGGRSPDCHEAGDKCDGDTKRPGNPKEQGDDEFVHLQRQGDRI